MTITSIITTTTINNNNSIIIATTISSRTHLQSRPRSHGTCRRGHTLAHCQIKKTVNDNHLEFTECRITDCRITGCRNIPSRLRPLCSQSHVSPQSHSLTHQLTHSLTHHCASLQHHSHARTHAHTHTHTHLRNVRGKFVMSTTLSAWFNSHTNSSHSASMN